MSAFEEDGTPHLARHYKAITKEDAGKSRERLLKRTGSWPKQIFRKKNLAKKNIEIRPLSREINREIQGSLAEGNTSCCRYRRLFWQLAYF
jgi:hypothetical protein